MSGCVRLSQSTVCSISTFHTQNCLVLIPPECVTQLSGSPCAKSVELESGKMSMQSEVTWCVPLETEKRSPHAVTLNMRSGSPHFL